MRTSLLALSGSQRYPSYYQDSSSFLGKVHTKVLNLSCSFVYRYSHAYYNVTGWAENSQEMKDIASRALSDRFWQAGISSGTRDEFYAKVSGTKATFEGLASTLRGVIRNTREACYSVVYCMSSLTEQFYHYDELPGPLAEALFMDAGSLTPHQFSTMISMMRYLVDNCPSSRREQFLTPILSNLLIQVDNKVTTEWNKIAQKTQANSEEDDLDEEMKDESILRHFTYSCVFMIAGFLDPQRESKRLFSFVSLSVL